MFKCPVCNKEYLQEKMMFSCARNHLNLNWHFISLHRTLSENFIRKFQDKVDWWCISYHQVLSENFIREFQDKVDWGSISKYQFLSNNFIKEFQDKVDLEAINLKKII